MQFFTLIRGFAIAVSVSGGAAAAQDFQPEPQNATGKYLTATEVKQILPYTQAQWVAVRPYEGQDLVYFTNLLSWRCGLHQIRYAVNGGEMSALVMEPCYADEGAPNALKMTDVLPYVEFPLDTVLTIDLELLYDDMSSETVSFDRADVQIN